MEKIKKDYYHYVDLVNKKRKKKKDTEITFEAFYDFYLNAILYAERKKLDPRLALIDESFYKDYYQSGMYIYNEQEEQPKKGFFKKIAGAVSSVTDTVFNKLKSLSTAVSSFFNVINMEITNIAVSTVKLIYNAIVKSVSYINIIVKKMNEMKANLFEAIKNGIIEIIGGEENIKLIKNKLKDQTVLVKIKNFLNTGPIRVSIGIIICCVILYVWTNSAFSGNIFFDFNVGSYTEILTTNDIFSKIKIELVIEVIAWFMLNQLISIPISWFGTSKNVYLVVGLITVSLIFKYIEKNSIVIGDIDFKQKICTFLSNQGSSTRLKNDITQLTVEMAKNIGVFGSQKNIKEIFCNYKAINKEKEEIKKSTSNEAEN